MKRALYSWSNELGWLARLGDMYGKRFLFWSGLGNISGAVEVSDGGRGGFGRRLMAKWSDRKEQLTAVYISGSFWKEGTFEYFHEKVSDAWKVIVLGTFHSS